VQPIAIIAKAREKNKPSQDRNHGQPHAGSNPALGINKIKYFSRYIRKARIVELRPLADHAKTVKSPSVGTATTESKKGGTDSPFPHRSQNDRLCLGATAPG
jgi:hypothetical protein